VDYHSLLHDIEEFTVTLQVGMISNSGIVIVGDTWQYIDPSRDQKIWTGYHASKIRISASGRIAVACARTMDVALRIADEIFAQCDEQVGGAARHAKIEEIGTRIAKGVDAECLIVFSGPHPVMYSFVHSRNDEFRCMEIYSAFATGDVGNPAYYWVMRYYKAGLTMAQLALLGALVNVSAENLNSGMVGGLEVLTCDSEGIQVWLRQESESLRAEAQRVTDQIDGVIFGTP
jgi:hypothetical protein